MGRRATTGILGLGGWLIALALSVLGAPQWLAWLALAAGCGFVITYGYWWYMDRLASSRPRQIREQLGGLYGEGRELVARVRDGTLMDATEVDAWTASVRERVRASLGEADEALLGAAGGLSIPPLLTPRTDPNRRRTEEILLIWLARLEQFMQKLDS